MVSTICYRNIGLCGNRLVGFSPFCEALILRTPNLAVLYVCGSEFSAALLSSAVFAHERLEKIREESFTDGISADINCRGLHEHDECETWFVPGLSRDNDLLICGMTSYSLICNSSC